MSSIANSHLVLPLVLVLHIVVCSVCTAQEDEEQTGIPLAPANALCGPSCLFFSYNYLEIESPSLTELSSSTNLSLVSGVSMLELKTNIEEMGVPCRAEKISTDELNNGDLFIIPVRMSGSTTYNHYYVIHGVEGERVRVFDGMSQTLTISLSELTEIWDGESLIISKVVEPPAASMGLDFTSLSLRSGREIFVSENEVTIEEFNRLTEKSDEPVVLRIQKRLNDKLETEPSADSSMMLISAEEVEWICDEVLDSGYQLPDTTAYRRLFAQWHPEYKEGVGSFDSVIPGASEGENEEGMRGLTDGLMELVRGAPGVSDERGKTYYLAVSKSQKLYCFMQSDSAIWGRTIGFRLGKYY